MRLIGQFYWAVLLGLRSFGYLVAGKHYLQFFYFCDGFNRRSNNFPKGFYAHSPIAALLLEIFKNASGHE